MATGVRQWKACALAAVALATGTGCNLIVEAGQMLKLTGGQMVFGSGGDDASEARPAVCVRTGGAVEVDHAEIFGGGVVMQGADVFRGDAAPGIRAFGGTVTVKEGLVAGGPAVVQAGRGGLRRSSPAIMTQFSNVEISGGTIRGGADVSLVPGSRAPGLGAGALEVSNGNLKITGGTFRRGAQDPMDPPWDVQFATLITVRANVEVTGGDLGGGIILNGGSGRFSGGRAFELGFVDACGDVRGGQLNGLVASGKRVTVYGTNLQFVVVGTDLVLRGTLEDGTPASITVLETNGGQIVLAPAGAPSTCPPIAFDPVPAEPGTFFRCD